MPSGGQGQQPRLRRDLGARRRRWQIEGDRINSQGAPRMARGQNPGLHRRIARCSPLGAGELRGSSCRSADRDQRFSGIKRVAFCTCRRFLASAKITEPAPVHQTSAATSRRGGLGDRSLSRWWRCVLKCRMEAPRSWAGTPRWPRPVAGHQRNRIPGEMPGLKCDKFALTIAAGVVARRSSLAQLSRFSGWPVL